AVGSPAPARAAGSAVQVRLDRAAIAGLQVAGRGVDLLDLHAELMAKNARIREERLPPAEGGAIGAPDAGTMHANERMPRRRRFGRGSFDHFKFPGLFQNDGFHRFQDIRGDAGASSGQTRQDPPMPRLRAPAPPRLM